MAEEGQRAEGDKDDHWDWRACPPPSSPLLPVREEVTRIFESMHLDDEEESGAVHMTWPPRAVKGGGTSVALGDTKSAQVASAQTSLRAQCPIGQRGARRSGELREASTDVPVVSYHPPEDCPQCITNCSRRRHFPGLIFFKIISKSLLELYFLRKKTNFGRDSTFPKRLPRFHLSHLPRRLLLRVQHFFFIFPVKSDLVMDVFGWLGQTAG